MLTSNQWLVDQLTIKARLVVKFTAKPLNVRRHSTKLHMDAVTSHDQSIIDQVEATEIWMITEFKETLNSGSFSRGGIRCCDLQGIHSWLHIMKSHVSWLAVCNCISDVLTHHQDEKAQDFRTALKIILRHSGKSGWKATQGSGHHGLGAVQNSPLNLRLSGQQTSC